nr:retrovirus-related Pol polyprotein from transposon TNT 1-94 [Tanacetum cinerariifolium]
ELEAHYMYMAQLQEVSPDAADSGPIFNDEPLQKVSNDDHYNVEEIDQNDDDNDLAKERELLASLIEKLKCEIDESKNCNKFLETSNKVLIEKLKSEIEYFKNKNKSLESSNNFFKEANNKLFETNNLLYADYKKSEAKLARRNSKEYASQMELKYAKVRGDFLSYKMDYHKSCTKYTYTINVLNQTISEMKDKLSAHQETISILSQQKEAQIKLYKTQEDKELDKVIELENKVKVLDNIVYKTGQSVQTMNMHNNKCRTSFAKLEFLKKAQRANPRLYDIGCYNDNLALMLAPDTDEMDESIPLDKQCQSSLEIFKVKTYVNTIISGVELCKQKIANRTYIGYIDPFIQSTIESNFCPVISRISAGLNQFHRCLNEEMVADLRYFNSFESEVDSLRSQLETQKTQFLNEIDRLFREYYYTDHMNAILGVYTKLDEVTNLQCDYLELLEKCKGLETELSKSKMMSKSFESVQKHAINLELELQQCKEKIKTNMFFKVNKKKDFCKECEQYFEIQDLKAQMQDKDIVISELKKLIEKLKGKSVDTKFEKSSVIRQPNAFKSQSPSVLGKPTTFSNSFHAMCVLKSVAKPLKEIVASESNKKPRNFTRKLYERVSKTCSWWYPKFTPSEYKWKPKSGKENVNPNVKGILHQTSVVRTPEQNGVVERRNHTLVEAARTMISAAKVPLFFWAEAISTACFTQNRSLAIPRHEKTPYHIINDQKLSVKFFHIFGSICYIVRYGENLDKMKEKGDECIFVGYSNQSRAFRVFNKRTRVIMESIHTMALNHDSLSLVNQRQANVPQADRTVTTSNEINLLFSLMFNELLNGSSKVVSKSSAVSAADAPNQRQQYTTPLNIHTTPAPSCQVPTLEPTVTSSENINQAEVYAEND